MFGVVARERGVPVVWLPERLLGNEDISKVIERRVDPLGTVRLKQAGGVLAVPHPGSSIATTGRLPKLPTTITSRDPVAVTVAGRSTQPWWLASWTCLSAWHSQEKALSTDSPAGRSGA